MKHNWIGFVIVAISALCVFFLMILGRVQPLQSVAFNQQIDTINERVMSVDTLQEYKRNIRNELPLIGNRRKLQQAYYSLGFINQRLNQFNEAYAYLLKSLNFKNFGSKEERITLYREMAVNYLALNQTTQAYDYFLRASSLLNIGDKNPLEASLHLRFSEALVEHTGDLGLAMNLLKRGVQLNPNMHQLIESYLLLADIHIATGSYEFAQHYLIMAKELSMAHEYEMHERLVISRLISVNYLRREYEKVISLFENNMNIEEVGTISLMQVVNSYQKLYGETVALEVLETYDSQLTRDLDRDWLLVMNAQILGNAGYYENALSKLIETPLLTMDALLLDWINQLKIHLQFALDESGDAVDVFKNSFQLAKEIGNFEAQAMLIEKINTRLIEAEAFDALHQLTEERRSQIQSESNILTEMFALGNQESGRTMQTAALRIVLTSLVGIVLTCLIISYTQYIKKLQLTISNQKRMDILTQTLTHESLYYELENDIDINRKVSFILIEIENLEQYNRIFGYLAGDTVLKQVGNVLTSTFSKSYVSRHAGNQFLVATYNSEERIEFQLDVVSEEFKNLAGVSPYADESNKPIIAISKSSGHLKTILDIDSCIKLADEQLKSSKIRGKSVVIY